MRRMADTTRTKMYIKAAAIPDYRGRAFYAISLSAPTARMADERIMQLRGQLLRARRDIAQALGGSTGR